MDAFFNDDDMDHDDEVNQVDSHLANVHLQTPERPQAQWLGRPQYDLKIL